MKGKIVSYDPQTGRGKIIIKNEGVKLFEIDNWIDYNHTPQVGMEVTFDIENNKLINISSLHSADFLFEQLNRKIDIPISNDLKIKVNVSLEECLNTFFENFKNIALKYKNVLTKTKTLPYKKLKRFILTAYNNLIEIDPKINDKSLLDVKNALNEIEYYYDKLLRQIKSPIYVNLEKLVLNRQENYLILKKRFESNKELSVENTKKANLLEPKIKELEQKLKTLNPKSLEYKEKMELLKSYKRKYVDLIDATQKLKEENAKIADSIKEFETYYKDLFEKFFKSESSILIKILKKELDVLAYEFDTLLWDNAKKSKLIQQFFKEAKIEGSYSTKTFMKYYLKNLEMNKMNEKDVELVEIFNELKLFNKNIIIYDRNRSEAREISTIIENIEHDSDVKIFDNIKEMILYIKDNNSLIDVVLVNVDKGVLKLVDKLKPLIDKIGAKIYLFSTTIEVEGIKKLSIEQLKKEIKMLI